MKLTQYVNNCDNENGFRTNKVKSIMTVLIKIVEKGCEYNIQFCTLCIDFKQTFNSVHRHKLIEILQLKEYALNA
jgi:hypothetical protein